MGWSSPCNKAVCVCRTPDRPLKKGHVVKFHEQDMYRPTMAALVKLAKSALKETSDREVAHWVDKVGSVEILQEQLQGG
jgi:hypothetical protein